MAHVKAVEEAEDHGAVVNVNMRSRYDSDVTPSARIKSEEVGDQDSTSAGTDVSAETFIGS
jgi:hypothetical protein